MPSIPQFTRPANVLDEMAQWRAEEARYDGLAHVRMQVHILDFAPKEDACPYCGEPAGRHATVDRGPIVDASLDGPILLLVKQGVYRCRSPRCRRGRKAGRYFRKLLPFTVPYGRYTHRARALGINAVKYDEMPFTKVVKRLAREFHFAPARSTAWRWHKLHGDQAFEEVDYQQWAVESLSGVVCIDEMYDGEFCLLVATDPLSKLTVGFQVITGKSVDSPKVAEFMRYLEHRGVKPDVVVTDESKLYPAALKDVWPKALHQVCIFHVLQHFAEFALDAVRAYVKSLPEDPKSRRGRPRKDQQPRTRHNERRKQVHEQRYRVLTHPDKLDKNPEAAAALELLINENPALHTVRTFIVDVYEVFAPSQDLAIAWHLRHEIITNSTYKAHPQLAKGVAKLQDDQQFLKMMTYTEFENLNRTNNSVERFNRWIRKKQKSHYRLRRKSTIANALALRMKQEREGRAVDGVEKLRKRPPTTL